MKPRLAIVGAGGHARVVLDAARSQGIWEIWGLVDDDPALHGTAVDGAAVHGGVATLFELRAEIDAVIVAVGSNAARPRLAAQVVEQGMALAIVVHRSAVVSEYAEAGAGTVVMAGAVVQPGASIGKNVVVNTAATVDHDCVISDGVHLAPGVHLAGSVHVGGGSMLGIGAVALPGVCIGKGCLIGAGSVVVHDIPDGSVAYGVPAKVR